MTENMEKSTFLMGVTSVALLLLASNGTSGQLRRKGICPWMLYRNSSCLKSNFLCFNGKGIDRGLYCNGWNDCGDNSDETYCSYYYECPKIPAMRKCPGTNRCILEEWFCDSIRDCSGGKDEEFCEEVKGSEQAAMARAIQWLNKQKINQSASEIWGSFVDKSAVVLNLVTNTSTYSGRKTRREMAYEVSIKLLSRLSKRKLQEIPSADLASYVNAFLVTCLDPRKFHGFDIVQELRSRVDSRNYTNPYVLLSLCNAGETITESDEMKLVDAFRDNDKEFWTDVQALAVMALACASRQPGNSIDSERLRELTLELKSHQYRNGTVENLQTTALVMQALLSADPEADPGNFDEAKALQQIMAMQEADGSFGSFQSTYYVLPVLNCKSLVDISSDHCEPSRRDENSALDDLATRSGPKIRVWYTLYIGDDKDLERNLALRVPVNMSFYGVMEIAAEIDSRYRFEYVVKDRKPYVTAISGFQADPERGKFWFLNTYNYELRELVPVNKSPADMIVTEDDFEFSMWYRSYVSEDSWNSNGLVASNKLEIRKIQSSFVKEAIG